jgi:hypothetical protein
LAGENAGNAPIPFWQRSKIRTLASDEAKSHSKSENFSDLVPWNTPRGDDGTPLGVIVETRG